MQVFHQQNCYFFKNKAASPIYLFEDSGILVGVTYNDVVPECYIITMDSLESEPFADVAPYIFEDMGRAFAVVKKLYRNTDLKKHVIGLNLVEIHSLDSVYQKFTCVLDKSSQA